MKKSIEIIALILALLVVGVMTWVWVVANPANLPAAAYIEQQQALIQRLNTPMPLLGGVTVLLTLFSAYLNRTHRSTMVMCLVAGVCFIASGLITRFGNQPINAIVMQWRASTVPADWQMLRDAWWRWHRVRTVCGIAALALLLFIRVRQWGRREKGPRLNA